MNRRARELGEIGDERGHQIAEVQLAGLHELTDRVLGRLEGVDKALADIAADLPRPAGIVRERRRHGLPSGQRTLGTFASGGSRVAGSATGAIGRGSGVVEPGRQCIGGGRGVRQRGFGLRTGSRNGILQRLPGGERPGRGIG
jgi:hypothetical protein